MKKRINIKKFDLRDWREADKLRDELKDNLYYNQTWFWCENCNKKHKINLEIPWKHSVKLMPIKCEIDEDHCWKSTGKTKKFGGIDIFNMTKDKVSILLTEGNVAECIVCGKKGLIELTGITDRIDLTSIQLKELNEYIQSFKNLGFKKLNEMTDNMYKKQGILRILKFDKEIRKIQNLEDHIIIYSDLHNKIQKIKI